MKCVACQSEIPDGSRFCGLCGARQDAPAPQLDPNAATMPPSADLSATLIQAPRIVPQESAPPAPAPVQAAPPRSAAAALRLPFVSCPTVASTDAIDQRVAPPGA